MQSWMLVFTSMTIKILNQSFLRICREVRSLPLGAIILKAIRYHRRLFAPRQLLLHCSNKLHLCNDAQTTYDRHGWWKCRKCRSPFPTITSCTLPLLCIHAAAASSNPVHKKRPPKRPFSFSKILLHTCF